MTVEPIPDLNTPIGRILEAAGSEGILVESKEQGRYAVLPLDDEVIDLLIGAVRSSAAMPGDPRTHGVWPVPGS